jgi:hypothetical protein
MQIIDSLTNQGYAFSVDHGDLVIKYTGQGQPDPATVKPLLEQLKANKREAIAYLQRTPVTLYQRVSDELGWLWQPGTREWLEKNRPDLADAIDQADAAANEAWLACEDGTGTIEAFRQALEQWRQANLRAIQAYRDTMPLSLAAADAAEIEKGREQLRRKGYFRMHSRALNERIAIIEHDRYRANVPQGIPVYTLNEIRLLQESVEAGHIVTIGELRQIHAAKRELKGAILK